ncbi:MAG TPA: YMGG-like glycine zipper-containing protein [Alphaproteobacteria bacterium]|nr:YMGG-like glycine zipper-containing protein [Alphaproteobacteria bacterium]
MKWLIPAGSVGILALSALTACTNPYDPGQRAAGGALIGAGSGAALGAIAGGGRGAALGALIGGGVGAAAGYATTPPPAPRYEAVPPPPAEHLSWVPGHWRWDGYRYVWEQGHYVARPYARSTWIPGHWVQRPQGWVWEEGHWG